MIAIQVGVSLAGTLAGAYAGLVLSHQVTYLVLKRIMLRQLDVQMPPAP